MKEVHTTVPCYILTIIKMLIGFNITKDKHACTYSPESLINISVQDKYITPFPIDLVYLWVNSSNASFIERKRERAQKYNIIISSGTMNKEVDFNEIKYSIRSIEMFAPWIRNIFIVSKTPGPCWLNFSHPRLHYINDDDITPSGQEYYDSSRMIRLIPHINGLSEHFIYSADDYFFGNYVNYTDFFTEEGIPRYHNFDTFSGTDSSIEEEYNKFARKTKVNIHDYYMFMAQNYRSLLECRKEFKINCQFFNFHIQMPFRKSYCIEVNKIFKSNELNMLMFNRSFRHVEDLVSEVLFANYAIMVKGATYYHVNERNFYSTDNYQTLLKELAKMPQLFCINSVSSSNNLQRKKILDWLQSFFSNPSQFEIIY